MQAGVRRGDQYCRPSRAGAGGSGCLTRTGPSSSGQARPCTVSDGCWVGAHCSLPTAYKGTCDMGQPLSTVYRRQYVLDTTDARRQARLPAPPAAPAQPRSLLPSARARVRRGVAASGAAGNRIRAQSGNSTLGGSTAGRPGPASASHGRAFFPPSTIPARQHLGRQVQRVPRCTQWTNSGALLPSHCSARSPPANEIQGTKPSSILRRRRHAQPNESESMPFAFRATVLYSSLCATSPLPPASYHVCWSQSPLRASQASHAHHGERLAPKRPPAAPECRNHAAQRSRAARVLEGARLCTHLSPD